MTAPLARSAGAAGAERRPDPSSPYYARARVRLPRLSRFSSYARRAAAGLLVLLAAALVPDGPARAQTVELWSGTMTAGHGGNNRIVGYSVASSYGTLQPNSFTLNGVLYSVQAVIGTSDQVEIRLSKQLPVGDYHLYIGGTSYPVIYNGREYRHDLLARGSNPITSGQTYAVRLVEIIGPPEIRIEPHSATMWEGQPAGFLFHANRALTQDLYIRVRVTTEGDFGVTSGTHEVYMWKGNQFRSGSPAYHEFKTTHDGADEANGSVTVEVVSAYPWRGGGYTVAAAPNNAATVQVFDSDPGPKDTVSTIRIAAVAASITEGDDAVFTLTADPAPLSDLPVRMIIDQAGNYGVQARRYPLTIPAGQSTVTHRVRTVDDAVDEPNGKVIGSILCINDPRGPGCETDFANDLARIKVTDNDRGPEARVSVASGRITEGDFVVFQVTFDPPLADPSTVIGVNARLTVTGGDFGASLEGYQPIPRGEQGLEFLVTRPVFITTTNDAVDEPDGQVTLTLLPSDTQGGAAYQLPRDGAHQETKNIYDDDGPPTPPLRPRVTPDDDGRPLPLSLTVRWDEVAEATGYEVRWGVAAEPARQTARVSAPQFTTPELAPGVTHAFDVSACNDAGCGEQSPEVQGSVELAANAGQDVGLVLPDTITLTEHSSETFDVELAAEPSGTVTVSVTSSRTEGFSVSPESLIFTAGNWNIAQQITVGAFQDNDGDEETVTLTLMGTGVIADTVTAIVRDHPITVRPLTICEWSRVSPHRNRSAACVTEGETENYGFALSFVPSGTVTVSVASKDTGAVTVSPGSLTFTPQNWSIEQQVSLTGVQDDDIDDELVQLRFSGGMWGLIRTVDVQVEDDDEKQTTGGGAAVLAFDVPEGHTLRTESIPGAHASMEPPAYRTFQTEPVEVTFVPPLDSGDSATVCLPGDGELSHYGPDGWTVLPTTHRMVDGVEFACSDVTSTSPFAVLHAHDTPPTANAGPDLEADPGETVTLQGKGSHNPHGRWHQMSLSDATRGDPSFAVPADAAPGTAFRFVLTVTDRDGETDSDSMTVTVRGTPPTANAGPDLEAAPGETITLQGTGSTNPHGAWWKMAHLWTQTAGPTVAFALDTHRRKQFAGRAAETFGDPAVTVPADAEPGTVIELALTVTDKDGESHTDTMTVTVRASAVPMVSVADARAEESDGWIAFELTLDKPAPTRASVEWMVRSGTATGGMDYRAGAAGSGTLWFAEGETTYTHWIRIFDDAHDEGEETFTLTLSDPSGLTIGDGEATGTIANSDPLLNAWLARFGRTVAGQTVDALTERFATPAGSGSHVTLGGQRIGLDALGKAPGPVSGTGAAGGDDGGLAALAALARDGEGRPGAEAGSGTGIIPGSVAGGETRSMTGRDLLLGSAFHLSAGGGDGSGPRWTGWGRAALERFENSGGGLPVDGEVMTGVFGADWERGNWLAGVALSHSIGEGEMRPRGMAMAYDLESTVTAVHPYVRMKLSDRVSAWGLVGYGQGDLTVTQKREATDDGTPAGRTTWKTDLAMTLGALGARGALLTPDEADGFGLALKGDAFLVRTTSDAIDGVEGLGNLAAGEADASRLRLVLEGSREMKLGEDPGSGTLTPSLEIGARHDGGDAETGMGLEIGGGLRYADPSSGVSMDLRARGLLAHEESGYREWGVSGSIRLAPGASGRGLSLSLTPAFGADAGSADRLWTARDAAALTANGNGAAPAGRLEMEVGYGLSAFDGGFTGTPYAGFGVSDTDRTYRLGWRLTRPADTGSFRFSLEGSRRETADDDAAPDHGIGFRATARW